MPCISWAAWYFSVTAVIETHATSRHLSDMTKAVESYVTAEQPNDQSYSPATLEYCTPGIFHNYLSQGTGLQSFK